MYYKRDTRVRWNLAATQALGDDVEARERGESEGGICPGFGCRRARKGAVGGWRERAIEQVEMDDVFLRQGFLSHHSSNLYEMEVAFLKTVTRRWAERLGVRVLRDRSGIKPPVRYEA